MLKPKKSLGQNFLIDKNICRKIINLEDIKNNLIIEIGPGTGQMTEEIIKKKPKKIILLEKDIDLYNFLKSKYSNNKKIEILNIDALKYDYKNFKKIKIISNLPYNLSSKIILKLLSEFNNIDFMTLMIQKEFAEKINYNSGTKKNKYNFFVDVTSSYKIKFHISNKVFYPKPKVNSTIVTLKPKRCNFDKNKLLLFSNKIFSSKRKKIKNIISVKIFNRKVMTLLNQRAEDLSIDELMYLFNIF